MAWRDEYRPGHFRGVPFNLKSSTATGGRRTVLNEYPLRDEPSTEDMGRRARKFTLAMTVIGADYMAQRDRLIEALETAGPGTLMHPFRGELLVAVLGDYSCEESTEQGGVARISATFVEAGATPRPDNQAAQGSAGNAAADALQADALVEFEAEFSVLDQISFVAESTVEVLQQAIQEVASAGGILAQGGTFGALFSKVSGTLQQLILAPGDLGLQLLGLVRSIGTGANPLQALKAQLAMFGLGKRAKAVAGSTAYLPPARAQLAANQVAIYRLIERAAISEAVRLAVSKPGTATNAGVDYDNRDQAVAIRDQLLDELDRQQLAASPQRYRQLAQLTAVLVSEMNTRAANLAPLTRVTVATTMPALLLAHRLYGDARQAGQVVTRNRIAHPGFVPGGIEIEVLKNA